MLTGTSKKKVPGKERASHLPRPTSDLDINEIEEDQYNLDNLGDEEVVMLDFVVHLFCLYICIQSLDKSMLGKVVSFIYFMFTYVFIYL